MKARRLMAAALMGMAGGVYAADFGVMKAFTASDIQVVSAEIPAPVKVAAERVNGLPEPRVEGRILKDCGYYSHTVADLKVQYRGILEPGARVYLKYGEIGSREDSSGAFAWENIKEVEMPWVSQGIRQAGIEVELHARGSNRVVNRLGFVIHVVMPNGEYYDNGSQSAWGSFEVPLKADAAKCQAGDYEILPVSVNNKW